MLFVASEAYRNNWDAIFTGKKDPVKNPYKHRPPKVHENVTLDPLLLAPPDVRLCPVKDHWHYDARWGGCPKCGDRGVPLLRKTIKKLEGDVASWKDAWYVQREATGRQAWQIPIPHYMSHVDIDPRVFQYFREVEYLLQGFFKLLAFAQCTLRPNGSAEEGLSEVRAAQVP